MGDAKQEIARVFECGVVKPTLIKIYLVVGIPLI
jgi:hypothetical protein